MWNCEYAMRIVSKEDGRRSHLEYRIVNLKWRIWNFEKIYMELGKMHFWNCKHVISKSKWDLECGLWRDIQYRNSSQSLLSKKLRRKNRGLPRHPSERIFEIGSKLAAAHQPPRSPTEAVGRRKTICKSLQMPL
ncbi:unnamed protein product [Nesidiocoris tenuis]|uniref:Uncharacterized protein n=1 Tax=Nesidiocoris tenuis TaxID=355587 RepID=A0A6H5H3T8_9HEMI|nr:unnamed protein product [Nesidiocoris tenuis]